MSVSSKILRTIAVLALSAVAVFAGAATAHAETDTARVEFRYPDQTGVSFASDGGVRDAAGNFEFSSQYAVISEGEARQMAGMVSETAMAGNFFVQVASMTDAVAAQAKAAEVNGQIEVANVNGTTYHRVMIAFSTEAEANAALPTFAAVYADAFVKQG